MSCAIAFKAASTNGRELMNTYEATVRVQSNNMYVKTRVQANTAQDALWLLEGQYGVGNVVTLPSLVD